MARRHETLAAVLFRLGKFYAASETDAGVKCGEDQFHSAFVGKF
jgi:hypothetical protein